MCGREGLHTTNSFDVELLTAVSRGFREMVIMALRAIRMTAIFMSFIVVCPLASADCPGSQYATLSASDVFKDLVRQLDATPIIGDSVWKAAVSRMKELSDDAVPLLLHAVVHDPSAKTRILALDLMVELNVRSNEGFHALVTLLEDGDERVRSRAANSIGWIGHREWVIQAKEQLIELLSDKDDRVQQSVLLTIRLAGEAGSEYVPRIVHYIKSPRATKANRVYAVFCLQSLGKGTRSEEVVSVLRELLKDDELQGCAIDALKDLGPLAIEAVSDLVKLQGDPSVAKGLRSRIDDAIESIRSNR